MHQAHQNNIRFLNGNWKPEDLQQLISSPKDNDSQPKLSKHYLPELKEKEKLSLIQPKEIYIQ